jgi:hypothetical protein
MLRLASLVVIVTTILTPVAAFIGGFDYDNQKVRGVNLGGWLVL